MMIGLPSAAVVRASYCENCAEGSAHVRIRHVTEAATTAAARRSLCAHCSGGMRELGHSVDPFTPADEAEYVRWLTAPRREAGTLSRWQQREDGFVTDRALRLLAALSVYGLLCFACWYAGANW